MLIVIFWGFFSLAVSVTILSATSSTRLIATVVCVVYMYIDANEFISQSGWFSFPGLPHCKEALHHVLAKKCKISYQDFIEYKEAVYYFNYTNGEKVK